METLNKEFLNETRKCAQKQEPLSLSMEILMHELEIIIANPAVEAAFNKLIINFVEYSLTLLTSTHST